MKELSEKLRRLVEAAEPQLRNISELESNQPTLPGGWSRTNEIDFTSYIPLKVFASYDR